MGKSPMSVLGVGFSMDFLGKRNVAPSAKGCTCDKPSQGSTGCHQLSQRCSLRANCFPGLSAPSVLPATCDLLCVTQEETEGLSG